MGTERGNVGAWVARSVEHLPLAQVMILGVLGSSPTSGSVLSGSLLVPLPLPLLPLVRSFSLSLSLSQIHKILQNKTKQNQRAK